MGMVSWEEQPGSQSSSFEPMTVKAKWRNLEKNQHVGRFTWKLMGMDQTGRLASFHLLHRLRGSQVPCEALGTRVGEDPLISTAGRKKRASPVCPVPFVPLVF